MNLLLSSVGSPLSTMLLDLVFFREDATAEFSDVFLFQNICEDLEKNLQQRASAVELRKKNIMKADYIIAPAIQAVQQQLKFQQISDKLEHKLEMRPSRQHLLDCNIIQDSSDAERTQQFHQKVDALNQQLESRPERKLLRDNNIIRGDMYVSGNLQARQQKLKFQQTVDSIDHKLEHRPPAEKLVDANIMKGFSASVAPNLYGPKHMIEFQKTSLAVRQKLNHRPSPDTLSSYTTILPNYYLQTNVFVPDIPEIEESEEEPEFALLELIEMEPCPVEEPVHFKQTAESLEHFLEHRPNMDTLLEHNILKAHTSVAPTLQANTQKLERKLHENLLNTKLVNRPDISQLKSLNILKREQGHVLTQVDSINRKQRSTSLSLRMENRPTAEEVPYLTPPVSPSTSPPIQ